MDSHDIYAYYKSQNRRDTDEFHGKSVVSAFHSGMLHGCDKYIACIRNTYKSNGDNIIYDVSHLDLEHHRIDNIRSEHSVSQLIDDLKSKYKPIKTYCHGTSIDFYSVPVIGQMYFTQEQPITLANINGKMYDTSNVYHNNGLYFSKVKKTHRDVEIQKSTKKLYVSHEHKSFYGKHKFKFLTKSTITHLVLSNCYLVNYYPMIDVPIYCTKKKQIKVLDKVLNTTFTFQYKNDKGEMVNGSTIKKIVGIYPNTVELITPIVTDYIEMNVYYYASKAELQKSFICNNDICSFYGNEVVQINDELTKNKFVDSNEDTSIVTYVVYEKKLYKNNKYQGKIWNKVHSKRKEGKMSKKRYIMEEIQGMYY
jgi:hypothetical protein